MAFLDTLKDAANKATEFAKEAGKTISEKASDVVEITSLSSQISTEKTNIANAKKELGELIWKRFEDGAALDDEAGAICATIKEAMAKIADFEAQIEALKAPKEEKAEEACCCEEKKECCCEEKKECCCEEKAEEACCCEEKKECCCEEKPATKICPLCGAEQPIDAKVCEICGYEFEA